MLDAGKEELVIRSNLLEARLNVDLLSMHCTELNFTRILNRGCLILHYMGHGLGDALAFEDRQGFVNPYSKEKILDDLQSGRIVKPQVVVVSACKSHECAQVRERGGTSKGSGALWECLATRAHSKELKCSIKRGDHARFRRTGRRPSLRGHPAFVQSFCAPPTGSTQCVGGGG
ncbi:MAG: hypothetical protein AAFR67_05240, partial [Chloroflexota bacterium]